VTSKTIAIGADHGGVALKATLAADLAAMGYAVVDVGTHGNASVDYPDYGRAVAQAVLSGEAWRGVVICGSGIGISIAANRFPGIRAALCTHGLMARLARQHNDANVLALGERLTGVEVARDCLKEFLSTAFEGGRHQSRVDKLSALPPVAKEVEPAQ
jgi:ribose 5-phosphate isomerase B